MILPRYCSNFAGRGQMTLAAPTHGLTEWAARRRVSLLLQGGCGGCGQTTAAQCSDRAIWRPRWPFLLDTGDEGKTELREEGSQTWLLAQQPGGRAMELTAVVRQVMERSFEASVREDTWS